MTRTFSEPQDWSAYNRLSLWVYVHPTSMRTYVFNLEFACRGAADDATTPPAFHTVQDLRPGEWNHVLWEIPHLQRDKVVSLTISQALRGHDPEDEGIVTYDIDQIELERVDAEPYQGWAVAPGRIALTTSAIGPATARSLWPARGRVNGSRSSRWARRPWRWRTGVAKIHAAGTFRVLDFSAFRTPGEYVLRTGTLESRPFRIAEDIWRRPTYEALNFFFCERCGYDVPGIHRCCHQDWQGSYKGVKKIINGGWHDAGDLSQGTWRTAMAVYAMLDLIQRRELERRDPALHERALDEALWGLQWLLKTQFGDGYRSSWSVMRLYTDNKLGTNDDVIAPAQNVPWENFLAAAVEALAVDVLRTKRPALAARAWSLPAADWDAAFAPGAIGRTPPAWKPPGARWPPFICDG